MESNILVYNQRKMFNILNDFYINIAKEIGIKKYQSADAATTTHPSIQYLWHQGLGASGEKGYLFSGSWVALKSFRIWGFRKPCQQVKNKLNNLNVKEKPPSCWIFFFFTKKNRLLRGGPRPPCKM